MLQTDVAITCVDCFALYSGVAIRKESAAIYHLEVDNAGSAAERTLR